MAASHKKWVPLESNPDVLNEYAAKLGADLSQYQFCDVFGLDEASSGGHFLAVSANTRWDRARYPQ